MKKIKLEPSHEELQVVAKFTAEEWVKGIMSKLGTDGGKSFVLAFLDCARVAVGGDLISDAVPSVTVSEKAVEGAEL